jgi:hypothetical protein
VVNALKNYLAALESIYSAVADICDKRLRVVYPNRCGCGLHTVIVFFLRVDYYFVCLVIGLRKVKTLRFKRAFNAAGRYSKRRIGKILTELYNTDRDIKRGNIDKDVALELIAISACP